MEWIPEALRWYLVLLILSYACAPCVYWLCRGLPDQGATLVRPIALLLSLYPAWLLNSLGIVRWSNWTLWISIGVLSIISWPLTLRRSASIRGWLWAMGWSELLSLGSFAFYIGFRGFAPWILNTEKPMDLALLSASARATDMPPLDPWMAGETINYYYLGYLIHGSLGRLADVAPSVGFNLAVATTFSLAVTTSAGLAFNLVRTWRPQRTALAAAALSVLSIVFSSNLEPIRRLLLDPAGTSSEWWWTGIGWQASRIVVDHDAPGEPHTINEFPAFSFILGDLHPHLMALPFVIMALGLAANLLIAIGPRTNKSWHGAELVAIAFSGGLLGSLYALNSWDYPTFLATGVGALMAGNRSKSIRQRLGEVGILSGASFLVWLPFYQAFSPPVGTEIAALPRVMQDVPLIGMLLTSFGAVTWERTSLREFLTVFGVPYAVSLLMLSVAWSCRTRRPSDQSTPLIIGTLGILCIAILTTTPVMLMCGLPLIAIGWLIVQEGRHDLRTISLALFGIGFALIIGTEWLYLRDVFTSRMNTLFKVYFQVWILFGLGTALGLVELWNAWSRTKRRRIVSMFLASSLLLAVLPYAFISGYQYTKSYGPARWLGLDGIAYMAEASSDELAALRWLRLNAMPEDVILEAQSCAYQPWGEVPTGRVSAFTGVPTVMGWENHERQWRAGQAGVREVIAARNGLIRDLYADPQSPLFEQYGVTLLYIGLYEQQGAGPRCPQAGPYTEVNAPSYPGEGWSLVFEQGNIRIYRRVG